MKPLLKEATAKTEIGLRAEALPKAIAQVAMDTIADLRGHSPTTVLRNMPPIAILEDIPTADLRSNAPRNLEQNPREYLTQTTPAPHKANAHSASNHIVKAVKPPRFTAFLSAYIKAHILTRKITRSAPKFPF